MSSEKSMQNIDQFNGKKYGVWKFQVFQLIDQENAMEVLTEDTPEQPNANWLEHEKAAKDIIIKHLSVSMLSFAKEPTTAKDIIKKLDDIYERQSLATSLAIERKLLSLKFNNEHDLSKHFMIFDELLTECELVGKQMDEMNGIARLLLTLPTSYDSVITAIETMTVTDENLNLAYVKACLLDHEAKLKGNRKDTNGKVLSAEISAQVRDMKNSKSKWNKKKNEKNSYNKNGRKNNKNNKRCHSCGRNNHLIKDCYYQNKYMKAVSEQAASSTHGAQQCNREGSVMMCD